MFFWQIPPGSILLSAPLHHKDQPAWNIHFLQNKNAWLLLHFQALCSKWTFVWFYIPLQKKVTRILLFKDPIFIISASLLASCGTGTFHNMVEAKAEGHSKSYLCCPEPRHSGTLGVSPKTIIRYEAIVSEIKYRHIFPALEDCFLNCLGVWIASTARRMIDECLGDKCVFPVIKGKTVLLHVIFFLLVFF